MLLPVDRRTTIPPRCTPRARVSRFLGGLALLLDLSACGGEAQPSVVPEPALAGSRIAQRDFHRVEAAFASRAPEERALVEKDLRAFLRDHPDDGRARVAKVYLAWLEIEQRRFAAAEVLLAAVRRGPPGAPRDLAEVGQAAILRRQGRPAAALALLEPLRGKLADPMDRALYSGELVRALVDARRFEVALDAMLDWAEQATLLERDDVVSSIEALVRAMPTEALEAGHQALAAPERGGSLVGGKSAGAEARRWLRGVMASTLTRVALTTRDAELARRLLQSGPSRLSRDSTHEALANLAAESAVAARVLGRSIGLVLDLSDDVTRRRSSEVARGIARALGLPRASASPEGVQLVTRDAAEPGEIDRALAALAGDGATILVAGVSDEGALAASLFAGRTRTPVIVLRWPPVQSPSPYTFVLGADPAGEEGALSAALARAGAHAPVRVGPGGAPCDATQGVAGASRFPVQSWRRVQADAVVVTGDSRCAQEVAAEVAGAAWHPVMVLGLEAADARDALSSVPVVSVGAGQFPFGSSPPDETEPALRGQLRAAQAWYAVLGRDAAVLSSRALAELPTEGVDDARSVEQRHGKAREALLRVRTSLWSTQAGGFEGKNRIERTLFATEVKTPPGAGGER